jgi:two-component system phosphate regulon response regulator OmpR
MPAGYFVELAESDRRAREVLANHQVALTILAAPHGAEAAMFDLSENASKLIIVTERPRDLGRLTRSPPTADAYLSLPLDQQEVLARVEAVLRPSSSARHATLAASEILSFDGYTIDFAGRSLCDVSGNEVPLTRAEFALLALLARHAGAGAVA